jgi:hypothetical protein
MINTPVNEFESSVVLCQYDVVGFHATSSVMCAEIEQVGFLPRKIFGDNEHAQIINVARKLGLDTSSYVEWLGMRSVTFTKVMQQAADHANEGRAGGQGLMHIEHLLAQIKDRSGEAGAEFSDQFSSRIQAIRSSPPVIYVVNLSGLGPRLVDDSRSGFLQMYWNPSADLPQESEIGPSRLIARLSIP